MADSLFAIVFPTSCSLCHREMIHASSVDICPACWDQIESWTGAACAQCGLPFPSERATDSVLALCPQCREGEFEFDRARSYGLYAGNLRAVILQLKFRRRERLGGRLGGFLQTPWNSLVKALVDLPILIPVPLHASRKRERGFNQSELLALGLSRKLAKDSAAGGPRVETHCLHRTRPTPPQTGLSIQARKENVRNVFAVDKPDRIQGRTVVLVDDVMTTGATLSAGARALKKAGALSVLGLTLAHATPHFPDQDTAALRESIDDTTREWT
ncbi:MAG TPA: ComF family protein [Terriglobia bacterium]|nr:ComF family protein [Terriglobia bacterium]